MAQMGAALPKSEFEPFLQSAEQALYSGKPNVITYKDLRIWLDHLGTEVVETTIIPHRTLMRRRARKEKLNAEETDKALRLARVTVMAQRVLHGAARAKEWLLRANAIFGGQPPYILLKTDLGTTLVEETLLQIEHGMFA